MKSDDLAVMVRSDAPCQNGLKAGMRCSDLMPATIYFDCPKVEALFRDSRISASSPIRVAEVSPTTSTPSPPKTRSWYKDP